LGQPELEFSGVMAPFGKGADEPFMSEIGILLPIALCGNSLYNHFRPHSSLGYQTPADYAGSIAATGSNATQDESFAFPPVAPTAPFGVLKTAEALIAPG